MSRLVGAAIALLLMLGVAAPAALAAEPVTADRTVLIAFEGDLIVGADEEVAAVIVTRGTATIRGDVNAVVVLDGRAILEGARVESVVAVNGTVSLDATTVVVGDVRTLNSNVERASGATVEGEVKGLEADLVTLGWVLAPAFFLFMLGLAVATVVAGLALAALAARQVRDMERLISDEPGPVLLAGFLGLFLIPLVAVLAIVTIVGAPIGIALIVVVWPAAAYIGYLVAGIWIGDWLLARFRGSDPAGRPYAAAVVGLIVLMVVGLIPLVGAVASLFGFGAVILHGWRAFRAGRGGEAVAIRSAAQPLGV
jgi:hypothetical protein